MNLKFKHLAKICSKLLLSNFIELVIFYSKFDIRINHNPFKFQSDKYLSEVKIKINKINKYTQINKLLVKFVILCK